MKKLSEIPKSLLEEYIFPGTDAAVLVIEGKIPQSELEDIFRDVPPPHRFYPTGHGWKIKFPYPYFLRLTAKRTYGDLANDFVREEKGWDHEHCSFCDSHVMIGDLSYTFDHKNGGVDIICQECSKRCRDA